MGLSRGKWLTPAQLVAELRGRRGYTQSQLAELLGVHLNTVWGWEAGKTEPSASHLQTLAGLARVRVSVGAEGWGIGRARSGA